MISALCCAQELPVVLLVNNRTASASEILAGALKDNCRAVVAGGPTFGKGLIQSVYELADGSGMAVTVGKYLTPAGVDIDRTGIVPDFPSLPRKTDIQASLSACRIPK
jgi:carboxyl-terminal processing protease